MEIRAEGWLGWFLRLRGTAREARRPIAAMEYAEMLALYQLEAEETEKEQALAQQRAGLRGMP